MGDGVAPVVQAIQFLPSLLILWVDAIDSLPESRNPQPAEIARNRALIGVSSIETSPPAKVGSHDRLKSWQRDRRDEMVDALRVQVAAVALKLGSQKDSVGTVDLLTPPSTGCATRGLDLIQFACTGLRPAGERRRRHRTVLNGVLICFLCDSFSCGPPTKDARMMGTFHGTLLRSRLLQLTKVAFPDDKEIQALQDK
jgi:hypothetical protein